MVNNQENTDKKVLYCPNSFFNNGEISIGEFKTFDEAMNFPIKEVWCINRTNDNKFQAYQSQSTRILIICNWSKSIQDSTKFVVALVFCNGKITYWDMNDLPMNAKNFENSLNNDVLYAIYSVADEAYKENNQQELNCSTNMTKKQVIRLTESDLHRIVKESVNKVLNESGDPYLDELAKEFNYYYSEAMQNLQGLLKAYNKLPEEYSNMKNSNAAMVRNAIKDLELAYKGKEWRDVPMM